MMQVLLIIILIIVILVAILIKFHIVGGDGYGDLTWVRGTDLSIFQSCYKLDDGYYLMSKGTQFKKGFVPMSETVDNGITDINGVNYESISGYTHDNIIGSAKYAVKAPTFDINKTKEMFTQWIQNPGSVGAMIGYRCNPIIPVYLLLRMKQYGIDVQEYKKYLELFQKTECPQKIQEVWIYIDKITKRITTLLNMDLSKFTDQIKEYNDENLYKLIDDIIKSVYPDWERKDLRMIDYHTNSNREKYELNNKRRSIKDFRDYIANHDFDRISVDIIHMRITAGDISDNIIKVLNEYCKQLIMNMETQKFIYNIAMNENPSLYTLTNDDKYIISTRCPLVLASTNKILTVQSQGENNIKDKIKLGKDGINIIYISGKKLLPIVEKILKDKNIDMEIRVDNDLFFDAEWNN